MTCIAAAFSWWRTGGYGLDFQRHASRLDVLCVGTTGSWQCRSDVTCHKARIDRMCATEAAAHCPPVSAASGGQVLNLYTHIYRTCHHRVAATTASVQQVHSRRHVLHQPLKALQQPAAVHSTARNNAPLPPHQRIQLQCLHITGACSAPYRQSIAWGAQALHTYSKLEYQLPTAQLLNSNQPSCGSTAHQPDARLHPLPFILLTALISSAPSAPGTSCLFAMISSVAPASRSSSSSLPSSSAQSARRRRSVESTTHTSPSVCSK